MLVREIPDLWPAAASYPAKCEYGSRDPGGTPKTPTQESVPQALSSLPAFQRLSSEAVTSQSAVTGRRALAALLSEVSLSKSFRVRKHPVMSSTPKTSGDPDIRGLPHRRWAVRGLLSGPIARMGHSLLWNLKQEGCLVSTWAFSRRDPIISVSLFG